MLLSRHTRRRAFIAGFVSAATWPLAARAQQKTMPVIGFLSGASRDGDAGSAPSRQSFQKRLNRSGASAV